MKNNKESNCLFCNIANGTIPSFKLYEDDRVFVFMDIHPIQKGHVLVIPKEHSALLTDLPAETVSQMFVVGQKMNRHLRDRLAPEAVSMFLSDGKAAGQEIPHAHLHLVPRWANDGFGFKFPEHYDAPPNMDAVKEIYERLKE